LHARGQRHSFLCAAAACVCRRFDPGAAALAHLNREGYVVIRDVANASELLYARELMWSFLEGAGVGVDRHSPRTWRKARPNQYGIVWEHGVGQSRFMWFMRTRPRLLQMFELIWGASELLTSFEGFSMMPPVEVESDWTLAESWFHTDQNGVSRPGLQTVQSFTSLYDQARRRFRSRTRALDARASARSRGEMVATHVHSCRRGWFCRGAIEHGTRRCFDGCGSGVAARSDLRVWLRRIRVMTARARIGRSLWLPEI